CFPDKFPPSKISLSIQEPKILPFSQKQKFKNRNPKPSSFPQKQKFKNRNPKPSSFPRRRESSPLSFSRLRQIAAALSFRIPAFAGMTAEELLFSRQIPAI
ncbi:hypothetical protein, partial [Neisseria bergeri]|uniref:hypothetical protein n=1 Tax=Neisseria bergeri TaxID=1906581 RepID=UPI0027DEBDDA